MERDGEGGRWSRESDRGVERESDRQTDRHRQRQREMTCMTTVQFLQRGVQSKSLRLCLF